MDEKLELAALTIISNVGMAKSMYIESIELAGKGKFEEAENKMKEGMGLYLEGHRAHASVLSEEAGGVDVKVNVLLMHAEDQLCSAETVHELAVQQIALYRLLSVNGIKLG